MATGDLPNKAFAKINEQHPDALLVFFRCLFTTRREHVVALAAQYRIPVIYAFREFPAAGGLMSYSGSIPDSYRQAGVYTGRILKGEKLADLPVVQGTKFELVINLKTTKALGLSVLWSIERRRRGDRIGGCLLQCVSLLLAQSGHRSALN